jgi:hypothetical protein
MKKEVFQLAKELLQKINQIEHTITKLELLLDNGVNGITISGNLGSGKMRGRVEVNLQPDSAVSDLVRKALAENRIELDKLYKKFEEA